MIPISLVLPSLLGKHGARVSLSSRIFFFFLNNTNVIKQKKKKKKTEYFDAVKGLLL
jgi:hypothetical protein